MPINYELCFKTPKNKWIYVPTDECRTLGMSFNKDILERWRPPSYFYHLRSGGHIAAFRAHRGMAYIAKMDIKNFFPSVTKNRIIRSLKSIGFYFEKAKHIAEWSVVAPKEDGTKRVLPYGFIQSQHLASLCLDQSTVGGFFRNVPEGVFLSVYVDDILISSNDKELLEVTYHSLQVAMASSYFEVNEEKSHQPQTNCTAFNIAFDANSAEITDDRFSIFSDDMLRGNEHRVNAIIHYVRAVNAEQADNLAVLAAV